MQNVQTEFIYDRQIENTKFVSQRKANSLQTLPKQLDRYKDEIQRDTKRPQMTAG